ncbi:2-heptaprenyl-1,4-naphthoquinone methyltransferase [Bacillus mycoides]|nr:2-heptaprenyl-1,4-naphthoquinone methyltransferase [Bacillus mycoides]
MKQQKQYWNEVAHEKQFTTPFRKVSLYLRLPQSILVKAPHSFSDITFTITPLQRRN